jgi:signal transduction histidine kinase
VSIIRYVVVIPVIAVIIMANVMYIAIYILSNEAVDYELKRDLRKSVETYCHKVNIEDGELVIDEDFPTKKDNVYYLVVLRNKEIIKGEYPKEVEDQLAKMKVNKKNKLLELGYEKYYVQDIRIGRYNRKGVFIRGVMRQSDAESFYRRIEVIAYLSIIGFLVFFLICEIYFFKKISKELKNMRNVAENIGSNLDVSQRMESNSRFYEIESLIQANNRMLDRMDQTFRLQEQFTSDVAHELRTPVATVLAQCQYAMEKVRDKEEFDEILEVIYRQSKRVNSIITQLLNFSRLDQDRVEVQNETLDLVEIASVICEEWQEKAENEVSIRTCLEKAVAGGDIGLISIVIENLISNAVKFSHSGGIVDVATGEDEDHVYVSVKDYGIGIAPEDLELVFRRFFQCDKSRNDEGFGLGLPLSAKIAEKHGGEITVVSELGKGSTFTLILPKNQF